MAVARSDGSIPGLAADRGPRTFGRGRLGLHSQLLQRVYEHGGGIGFGEYADMGVGSEAVADLAFASATRDHDRKVRTQLSQLGGEMVAGPIREPEIDDDRLNFIAKLLERTHCVSCRARLLDLIPGIFERIYRKHPDEQFVFNDQDTHSFLSLLQLPADSNAAGYAPLLIHHRHPVRAIQ
jgi:hypothetical protein